MDLTQLLSHILQLRVDILSSILSLELFYSVYQDLKLIASLSELEDRIILLSVFKRYYAQDTARLNDVLRKQLEDAEKAFEKGLITKDKEGQGGPLPRA